MNSGRLDILSAWVCSFIPFARYVFEKRKTTVGLTIVFYSVLPQGLVSLFAKHLEEPLDDAYMDAFLQKLQPFPRAAFPPRLLLPDSLCRIRSLHHAFVPVRFEDVCVRHVWDDGCGTEQLVLLSEQFVRAFVACTESEMEQVAAAWASTFPYEGLCHSPFLIQIPSTTEKKILFLG